MKNLKYVLAGILFVLGVYFLSVIFFKGEAMPTVKLTTSMGEITIQLDQENAPITTENFLKYVESGFYDGTIFHRVIPNFMIQGGGHLEDMTPKDDKLDPILNEANNGLQNVRGSIAMARTANPHSASSQFFINHVDNPFLNFRTNQVDEGWGYAVFGQVIEGIEVVDEIAGVQTGGLKGYQDVPVEVVVLLKAELVN
jgi:peptidyl-prolyl cis-trans isomerase B (cyclophilin B)